MELFQRTCEEAKDWMVEKMAQLDTAELALDLKTVQALQRRHENLERELAPVQEKVKRVTLLANSVKKAYPNELNNVSHKEKEIIGLWETVKDKAIARRNRLQDVVGQKIFENSCNNIGLSFLRLKDQLNKDNITRDVETAEKLLKDHEELMHTINSVQAE